MAEDWKELLDMDATQAVRPPPFPNGTYRVLVASQQMVKSDKKQTPGVEFTFKKWDPKSDVNSEKWLEFLKHPAIAGTELVDTDTFWLTRKAMPRLREFAEKCGAKPDGTMAKMVSDAVNSTILVVRKQRVLDDGQTVVSDIESYAADVS